ncbi:hypothetical protein RA276_27830, partial [Pseudomonas syringae pv. tagetis]|uniref:hypothetical protein n=1 Tax=Pseudomonas syringae group genomosp. 7 TaxID=251699 RepID=UPI00376FAE24
MGVWAWGWGCWGVGCLWCFWCGVLVGGGGFVWWCLGVWVFVGGGVCVVWGVGVGVGVVVVGLWVFVVLGVLVVVGVLVGVVGGCGWCGWGVANDGVCFLTCLSFVVGGAGLLAVVGLIARAVDDAAGFGGVRALGGFLLLSRLDVGLREDQLA